MPNIREVIIKKVLERLNWLLIDYNMPGQDPSKFNGSQFQLLFNNANTPPDERAYDSATNRTVHYPLSSLPDKIDRDNQITERHLIIEEGRILKAIRIGFIPVAQIEEDCLPALFITGATDTFETTVENQGNIENAELYPINLRLVLNQEKMTTPEQSNVIVSSRIREALDYVLDYSIFFGMSAERRGYDYPSTVRDINIAAGQNLEEFETPYEVIDYRVEVVFVKQKSLNSNLNQVI